MSMSGVVANFVWVWVWVWVWVEVVVVVMVAGGSEVWWVEGLSVYELLGQEGG